MGTGIMGAIPLSFRFSRGTWESDEQRYKEQFTKHAPKDFFDFYNEKQRVEEIGGKEKTVTYYVIKPEVLLPNFKDFFFEFHRLIGETPYQGDEEKFSDEYDAVVATNDLDKFIAYFEEHSGGVPGIFPYFKPMYISECKNLLIYHGSYKAILEEWSTLSHMERLLWEAMKHPLAKVMRFGMSL
jgi:hypothetical protein